jgi:hypothetical protein
MMAFHLSAMMAFHLSAIMAFHLSLTFSASAISQGAGDGPLLCVEECSSDGSDR